MISCNQKSVVSLLLSLALALTLSADAAQVQHQIQSQSTKGSGKLHDPDGMLNVYADPVKSTSIPGDGDEGDDEDDHEAPVYTVKTPTKSPMNDDEDEEKQDHLTHKMKEGADLKKVQQDLSANLHKQAELKNSIERLSNESESDEEIDEAAKQIANETESVALGNMVGHMWKDMRMLELPAYSKHVKEELQHLRRDESDLEAKLTVVEGKMSALHRGNEKQESKQKAEEKETKKKTEDVGVDSGSFSEFEINFWKSSHQQQKSILMSSFVYVVGGLLAAVLFKQMREKYFVLEPKNDSYPSPGDFSFHIFGCLDDKKLCFLGFFCPFLAWANTLDQRKGLLPYWPAFLVFFCVFGLHVYTMGISSLFLIVLGVYYRQKLRESYDLDSCYSGNKKTIVLDILFWCFCQPCAIIQEAREEGVRSGMNRKGDGVTGP